ncbi:MAG: hypothetical protein LQ340_002999 [Diploschistes diacapsis]|nr:MAG: hypothetical protein LQ340_002999 [Diploschistes diacapsis]
MPVYKEILTPPTPSHAVELSTSLSVQYKVRAPRADEKYRRNRQHSDISAYNTLPDEAYPLMQPEPRFEAPPCEEDLRHLARSRAPRRSIEVPGPKSGAQRSGSVEPDMDPRTGFVYRGH